MVISQADFAQQWQQVQDSIVFLQTHTDSLEILHHLLAQHTPAAHFMELDFGVEDRVGTVDEDGHTIALQADFFPPELIELMGKYRIGLNFSRYPRTEPDDFDA